MEIELSNNDMSICLEALKHYHKTLIEEGYDLAEADCALRTVGWNFYASGIVSNVARRFSEKLDEFAKERAQDGEFVEWAAYDEYQDIASPLHKS